MYNYKHYADIFLYGRCNTTYYPEICRHLNVTASKHSGVSPLTGKKSKSKESTAVKDHMLFCDHIVSSDVNNGWSSDTDRFYVAARHLKIEI